MWRTFQPNATDDAVFEAAKQVRESACCALRQQHSTFHAHLSLPPPFLVSTLSRPTHTTSFRHLRRAMTPKLASVACGSPVDKSRCWCHSCRDGFLMVALWVCTFVFVSLCLFVPCPCATCTWALCFPPVSAPVSAYRHCTRAAHGPPDPPSRRGDVRSRCGE